MPSIILKRIHEAHQGKKECILERNEQRHKNVVTPCEICREHQRKNPKETLLIKEQEIRPFQNIAADIFKFNCQQLLLVADQCSKMPLIKAIKTVTCANCIEYFIAIFAVHGIPEQLYTDNSRYFVSNEFHNFTTEWEFTHITPSLRYPQSNKWSRQ